MIYLLILALQLLAMFNSPYRTIQLRISDYIDLLNRSIETQ